MVLLPALRVMIGLEDVNASTPGCNTNDPPPIVTVTFVPCGTVSVPLNEFDSNKRTVRLLGTSTSKELVECGEADPKEIVSEVLAWPTMENVGGPCSTPATLEEATTFESNDELAYASPKNIMDENAIKVTNATRSLIFRFLEELEVVIDLRKPAIVFMTAAYKVTQLSALV
jgi:hypothetical protein